MEETQTRIYINQFVRTATNGNVAVAWSPFEGRSHFRCKRCSAILIIGFSDFNSTGELGQHVQDWVKGHIHDLAQSQKEDLLRKELLLLAENATRGRQSLQDLQFTKEKMLSKIPDKKSAPAFPESTGRKFR